MGCPLLGVQPIVAWQIGIYREFFLESELSVHREFLLFCSSLQGVCRKVIITWISPSTGSELKILGSLF
jgi:hypothetical protein